MMSDQSEGPIRNTCRVGGHVFYTRNQPMDICREHWYEEEMTNARLAHEPLFAAIKAATGLDSHIWQSGGMTMTIVTPIDEDHRYLGLVESFNNDGTLEGSCSHFDTHAEIEDPEEGELVFCAYAKDALTNEGWASRIAEHLQRRPPVRQPVVRIAICSNEVATLLADGVSTDGGHHKQWYLEQIAQKLDVALPDHDKGIAP